MGAILIFFVTGILADIFRLIMYSLGLIFSRDFSFATSPHPIYFFTCLLATLFVVIYGSFEASNIRTEYLSIPTAKISKNVGRVRIAQISDVHLGLIIGEKRIKSIVNAIQEAKPDILVSTGDLVDGQLDNLESLSDSLRDIKTPHGKFAVTGNHEFYAGLDRALTFTKKAGFQMLMGEVKQIPGLINIAGIDDEAARGWSHGENKKEIDVLSNVDNSNFTVFLKHRPVAYDGPSRLFDLQLSGHTHKGQIFPFSIIVRLFFSTYYGFHHLDNGAYLYVSRGTGTWGPPIRFLAPPEVTIIDLIHKAN
jgi:predicted MPP superfamily phosphohydrolase